MSLTESQQNAGVAELADAQASGACGRKIMWVQVPSPAFFFCRKFDYHKLSFITVFSYISPLSEGSSTT